MSYHSIANMLPRIWTERTSKRAKVRNWIGSWGGGAQIWAYPVCDNAKIGGIKIHDGTAWERSAENSADLIECNFLRWAQIWADLLTASFPPITQNCANQDQLIDLHALKSTEGIKYADKVVIFRHSPKLDTLNSGLTEFQHHHPVPDLGYHLPWLWIPGHSLGPEVECCAGWSAGSLPGSHHQQKGRPHSHPLTECSDRTGDIWGLSFPSWCCKFMKIPGDRGVSTKLRRPQIWMLLPDDVTSSYAMLMLLRRGAQNYTHYRGFASELISVLTIEPVPGTLQAIIG